MNLPTLAVRRIVTFSMIFVVIGSFGFLGLRLLPMDLFPDMQFPIAAVISEYQGASPGDMESLVSRPIEEATARVSGVKNVMSQSRQGVSFVIVEFEWGGDMDQAKYDIRENIELIRDMLPQDMRAPLVIAFDPSMMPVVFLGLGGNIPTSELRALGLNIVEPLLERIPGVAAAGVMGGLDRQIQVQLDPTRMRAKAVSAGQVVGAIRAENVQIPTGSIDQDRFTLALRAEGKYTGIDQIAATVVGYNEGSPIRVRDVADVLDTFAEPTYGTRVNGAPGVIVVAQKQSDANSVDVANRVVAALPGIQDALPANVQLSVIFEQSGFIERALGNLTNTAILAFVMAALVLLVFLRDIRASLIVALGIPISIMATFFAMYLIGISLNVISMAGLALAVGLLVDNAIVVLENTVRFMEDGLPALEAAQQGPSEILMAITASTLTTISVFVPVLFVPGLAGVLFKDMALTICVSLAVSLFVAVTLVPMMGSRLLRPPRGARANTAGGQEAGIRGAYASLERHYLLTLNGALRHRGLVLTTALLLFVVSMIAGALLLDQEYIPEAQQEELNIQVERAPGTSLAEMEHTVSRLERIVIEEVPEAYAVMTQYGPGEGFASFSATATNQAMITLELDDIGQRTRNTVQIRDAIKPLLESEPGVTISFVSDGGTIMSQSDIVVEIYGHDLNQAQRIARDIQQQIETIPGVFHLTHSYEVGRPEIEIQLQRDYISQLGLTGSQVIGTLSTYLRGTVATWYTDRGREYQVLVRAAPENRSSIAAVNDLLVSTPLGTQVPLADLVQLVPTLSPTEISRKNQERMLQMEIDVEGRGLSRVTGDVEKVLRDYPWPTGTRWAFSGAAQDMLESFFWLIIALMGGTVLVYMVMASQFESLLDPFIIIFTIPLSFIGVVWMLLLTGTTLSVVAFIGVILLIGIVVNNAIVLIDYIEQLRTRGLAVRDAVITAARRRLRPILMTALTTILAMTPLTLKIGTGAELWSPMGRAVVGGLITSTLLTLIIIPTMYTVFADMRGWFAKKRQTRRARWMEVEESSTM